MVAPRGLWVHRRVFEGSQSTRVDSATPSRVFEEPRITTKLGRGTARDRECSSSELFVRFESVRTLSILLPLTTPLKLRDSF